jgi:hypothetical protein
MNFFDHWKVVLYSAGTSGGSGGESVVPSGEVVVCVVRRSSGTSSSGNVNGGMDSRYLNDWISTMNQYSKTNNHHHHHMNNNDSQHTETEEKYIESVLERIKYCCDVIGTIIHS